MNSKGKSKVVEIIAAILILLFAYTSISKLSDHKNFVFILKNSPFINKWALLLSWGLPAIELITTLLLLFPSIRILGLYMSFGLMIVFTVYIGLMLTLPNELPCSCGGVLNQLSWRQHLILNGCLTILSGIALLFEFKKLRKSISYPKKALLQ